MKKVAAPIVLMLLLTGYLDLEPLNQFDGQHISWSPPSFSSPAAIGSDRYEMTYRSVTEPNYFRLS